MSALGDDRPMSEVQSVFTLFRDKAKIYVATLPAGKQQETQKTLRWLDDAVTSVSAPNASRDSAVEIISNLERDHIPVLLPTTK